MATNHINSRPRYVINLVTGLVFVDALNLSTIMESRPTSAAKVSESIPTNPFHGVPRPSQRSPRNYFPRKNH
jgi:hypothetical protein